MAIYHQNTFSRTVANEGKMGAYYTDLAHCASLKNLFHFPEGEEVSVLEPSIGNGAAVLTVVDAEHNPNVKVFGVELNDSVADEVKENPLIEDVLKADFLQDVMITNNCFSFCFGNPPYLDDAMEGGGIGRMERAFLEKVGNYLMKDAVLVWVIPYYVFAEESYFRYWNSRYETLALYKFRGSEFERFHQVVVVGRKRKLSIMFSKNQMEEMRESVKDISYIPELPTDFSEKVEVLPSPSSAVTMFATREFNVDAAYKALADFPVELKNEFDKQVAVPKYFVSNIGRPPIPLKKDSMYLLATSGGGQGVTGSEETGDLHLQRGVAEVIEEGVVEPGATEDSCSKARVTTRTQVSMTVIQNNGRIDKLV